MTCSCDLCFVPASLPAGNQARKFSTKPIAAVHSVMYRVKLSGWTVLKVLLVSNGKHSLIVTESDSLY